MVSVSVHNCIRYYQTAEEIGAVLLRDYCSQLISSHWVSLRPMSDTQQSWATLSRNFVARQSCLSDIASFPTFVEFRN